MKTILAGAAALMLSPDAVDQNACAELAAFFDGTISQCSLQSDGSQVCLKQFAFRSEAATAYFKSLNAEAVSCLTGTTTVSYDEPVNHPDSYRLVQYETPNGLLSLSVKDKAAHERTYVFVRYAPAATSND